MYPAGIRDKVLLSFIILRPWLNQADDILKSQVSPKMEEERPGLSSFAEEGTHMPPRTITSAKMQEPKEVVKQVDMELSRSATSKKQ